MTAIRTTIPVVTVINNIHALIQYRRGALRGYQCIEGGTPEVLWQFTDVDLSKVAESMGCFGIRVEKPGDIQSALEQAFASGRPAVVDVVTDQFNSEAPVPWAP